MNNRMGILFQLMQSKNPQEALLNILEQNAPGNPMLNSVLQAARSGNTKEIERIARNMCAEKHVNPDAMLSDVKQKMR